MRESRTHKLLLANLQQTKNLGCLLSHNLDVGTVILLKGDLGAGKTTLVQGLGHGLGITEKITSPTFTLINEYTTGRIPLYHLDLYRLTPQQTSTVYPEIYWDGEEVEPGITAIEWSERLAFIPSNYMEINLVSDYLVSDVEGGRTATIKLCGEHDLNLSFLDKMPPH